ncbi:UvrABC system protein B [Parachlamydia acanthamoebae UV-7]|uniref:UvrABC system protein B n=2 Tax=Parachlamydia acanthamoebae TaxID=83552 RepID=F8KUV4_PARAV|nr:excinuclease ABC subunit UvrB [Parachlamydia acanthamoebae]KIA76509.1 UvrABC system protein B [Parachlamydia acanthamoebae]CCB85019.1 UvrABC system protein B [Parachlamydia acanthamoebae UV-7]
MSGNFQLESHFPPGGDQPQAIEKIVQGITEGKKSQVLLGITGSGKTYTMANVVAQVQRPTLVIAHNKTLAAQLYQEFKSFFPHNAIEYFVSYYDYYQPEAYIARTDTYIEKDMAINDRIDKMRLSATRSLLERRDVLIVASVSCIYGLGTPEYYRGMNLTLATGQNRRRDDILLHLVEMQYTRNDYDFSRATFRVRGDVLEIFPAYEEDLSIRVEFFGDDIERISEIDPLTGKVRQRIQQITIYPSSHHVTPEEVRWHALETIKAELAERMEFFEKNNLLIERQRIQQRTQHDMEMIREIGFCKGIENYSRHFSQRQPGDPPPCLIDYFPSDFLLIIDESHQTLPQMRAMYNGDKARKAALVDFGFRLPSAYDNRPLKFEESYSHFHQVVYVSATPAEWEVAEAEGEIVEQVIRPTGLLDPIIEVRPADGQVDDSLAEIRTHVEKGGRVLVTTLTKRLAEELTTYLTELDVKAKYLHSDIDTLERSQIIQDLRAGTFDVLVGINLLREGLDIPEVSLVAILDADKEGFLRSETSLIQTCGRAARNSEGRVIMYANKITKAIRHTLDITESRRAMQHEYNLEHGITPRTVKREISPLVEPDIIYEDQTEVKAHLKVAEGHHDYLTLDEIRLKVRENENLMKKAAKEMQFEDAAHFRDLMKHYQQLELGLS